MFSSADIENKEKGIGESLFAGMLPMISTQELLYSTEVLPGMVKVGGRVRNIPL